MTPPVVDETQTSIAITDPERRFQMARRQAIIIELGAIEDYLGLERSVLSGHKLTKQKLDEFYRQRLAFIESRAQPKPEELRDKFVRITSNRNVE